MAGRGPAPKDPSKVMGHRTKAEKARKALPPVADTLPGPDLPATYKFRLESVEYDNGKRCVTFEDAELEYDDLTRDWYEDWRRSPQVSQFTRNAWRRLLMLAPLVDQYHRHPTKEVMAELRQNEAKLGATPEDMQRLHWSVPSDEAEKAKTQTPNQRRSALKVV